VRKPHWTINPDPDSACKWPGAGSAWSYKLSFVICNPCPDPVTIKISNLENNAGKALVPCNPTSLVGQTVTVPGGGCVTTDAFAYKSSSSANFIDVYGVVGDKTVLLAEVAAPVQACAGTSPCV
jgi:hypothetical protein